MRMLQVVRKDLLRFFRDRRALVVSLVLPLIITFIMGLSFGGGVFGKKGISAIRIVGVTDGIPQMLRDPLTEGLEETGFFSVTWADSNTADEMVRGGEAAAAIVLPDDLVERFFQFEPIRIRVWKDPGSPLKAGIVEQVIERSLSPIQAGEAVYAGLWPEDIQPQRNQEWTSTLESYFQGDVQSVWKQWKQADEDPFWDIFQREFTRIMDRQAALSDAMEGPGVALEVENKAMTDAEGPQDDVNLFNYFLPTFSVFFLMFGVAAAARDFHREREMGTLNRQLLSPLNDRDFVLGKWMAAAIQGSIQLLVLFLAGAVLFRVNLGSDPWSLPLAVILTCTSAAGFFLLITLVCRTEKVADTLSTITVLAAAMLGGNMMPVDQLPDWVRSVGQYFFNYWANVSFSRVMVSDENLLATPQPLLMLGGSTVLFLVASLVAYRIRRAKGGVL